MAIRSDLIMRMRHIEIFQALMLTHSVTRTAVQLHTSQPTVSRYLAELEFEIGFKLFTRTAGKLAPTQEADILNSEVQRSFMGLDRIAEVAAGIAGFRGDRLRISSISAFSFGFLPKVVQRFRQKFENVAINLEVTSFNEVLRSVVANQCEIGFVAYSVEFSGISQYPITEGRSVCALPARHRLASKKSISATDLRGEPMICLSPNVPSGQHVERIFSEAKIDRVVVLETQNAGTACTFVKQGLGVSILDPFTVGALLDKHIVMRPFVPGFPFKFSALMRSDRPAPRIARRILEEVHETIADEQRSHIRRK